MPRDLRGPYPADDIPPATDVLQMFLFFPFFFWRGNLFNGKRPPCWIIILLRSAHPVIYDKALPLCFSAAGLFIYLFYFYSQLIFICAYRIPPAAALFRRYTSIFLYNVCDFILFLFLAPQPLDCERGSADTIAAKSSSYTQGESYIRDENPR
jgi:hypothetical protein